VEDILTSTMDILLSTTSLAVFKDNLANIENGRNSEASLRTLALVMSNLVENSNTFYRAKVLNNKGMVVAVTNDLNNEKPGDNRSDRDYFKEGMKGPFISEPYFSSSDGVAQIAYSAPIYDKSNVPIGVLIIHQALKSIRNSKGRTGGIGLNDITTTKAGHGQTGETYIVTKDGLLFTESRYDSTAFMKYKAPPCILANVTNDSPILEPYLDYHEILTIGKAVAIKGTDWVLVGELDKEEAFGAIYKLQYQMFLITFIIIVLVTLLAWFFARYFSAPIVQLTEVAKSMATGALNQVFAVHQKDELGELGNSFKAMQQSLQVKAEEARDIAEGNLTIDIQLLSDKDVMGQSFKIMVEKLRVQFNEISEGINVLASSSSEIMASVTQLAASSAETATSVGETTTTVEEVKQTAEVANQKAKAVSENAVRTTEISADGTKAIANTIEGMNRIRQHMNAIAAMVVRLSDQSQTIGEITASVNELAEQSNLLAVNAAIEAAKAGEQGKGFTVVAQEIKMLSDRSKEATVQIRSVLRDIQKSISSAVMATEEGGKAVDEGLKLTTLSGDTIKTLSESVTEAARAAIQIAASSQQQLEGMDQVVTAMENIKEASVQAAASTQQSVDSVNDLQKVGQKLDALMKQYKLVK
jgi:methyl-accepting chemotaxis protein